MTIFRGPGGGGNATSDSEVNILTALTNQALAYSEQAGLEADAAAVSAAAASGSAFDANASAVASAASAVGSAASAAAALASETEAALSESAAAISASNALASENNAATAASTATTQAGLSAASAAASDASALASAASASTATTQAGNASTSATAAAGSATAASGSATTATTQASNASSSASAASTSATNSAASAVSAAASAASAATLLDNFDDRYLGPKASDPTLDNDGNAIIIGALYFNTTAGKMKVFTSLGWVDTSSAIVVALTTFEYVATAGQTSFSGNDANGVALAYTPGGLIVSLNGLLLRPGDDYTASTGTSIVLVSAAVLSDELQVHAFNNFSVANTYTKAEVDGLLGSAVPSGTVIHVAMNNAPTGYLKANGAAISRSTYAALFSAIGTTFGAGDGSTTFTLPELRGEFLRGWDDGRGVDSGRTINPTAQGSQNLSHSHGASSGTSSVGAPTGYFDIASDAGGSSIVHDASGIVSISNAGNAITVQGVGTGQLRRRVTTTFPNHTHGVTVNADGGSEGRPRNIAMLACIKF